MAVELPAEGHAATDETTRLAGGGSRISRDRRWPMTLPDDLLTEVRASRTDLARVVEAACCSGRPYVVVPTQAVAAWEQREPLVWKRVSEWLAEQGRTVVQV